MKASQLIAQLARTIAEDGDREVRVRAPGMLPDDEISGVDRIYHDKGTWYRIY